MTSIVPVDRTSDRPLWAQVRRDVERRIRRGEFSAAFPGELALVEEYGVSRQTVRQAMRALRDAGLVESGRGRVPRVVDREISQRQGSLYSLFNSVESSGRRQRSVVRQLDLRADGTVAARLGLEESTPLVYLERLRMVDADPLAIDRVWLPASDAAPLLEADFTDTSLYDELARRCELRLTGGREEVRAVVPSEPECRQLGIEPGAPALAIARLGESRGRPIEWRQTLVRGDRFTLVTDLGQPDDRLSFALSRRLGA